MITFYLKNLFDMLSFSAYNELHFDHKFGMLLTPLVMHAHPHSFETNLHWHRVKENCGGLDGHNRIVLYAVGIISLWHVNSGARFFFKV